MAHDITEAAFSNDGAWHGLGTVVPRNMEPEEGFKLAGLDWTLEPEPVYLAGPQFPSDPNDSIPETGSYLGKMVPNRVALCRSDTGDILGTASDAYTPFQNADLLGLAKELQEIDGTAYLESALQLGGGRDIVLLMRMREWDVMGDKNVSYITLWNNHDGSLPLHAYGTDVRVVCRNTLNWSAGKAAGKVKIRHTRGIQAGSRQLIAACKAAKEASGCWEDVARTFAAASIPTYDRARSMLEDAYKMMHPKPEAKTGESQYDYTRRVGRWQTGMDSYLRETVGILRSPTCNTKATKGTAFGIFNAVTEWLDHSSPRVKDRKEAQLSLDSTTNIRKRELVDSLGMSLQLSGI